MTRRTSKEPAIPLPKIVPASRFYCAALEPELYRFDKLPFPSAKPAELPKFDFGGVDNTARHTELETALPPRVDNRTALIRRIARLLYLAIRTPETELADQRFISAARMLRLAYSKDSGGPGSTVDPHAVVRTVVDVATALVSNQPIPAVRGATADSAEAESADDQKVAVPLGCLKPAQPALGTDADQEQHTNPPANLHEMYGRLNHDERQLVLVAMGGNVDDFDGDAVAFARFLSCSPAERELRMQNTVSSCFDHISDFRYMEGFRRAHDSIYAKCGIRMPTGQEMCDYVIANPQQLSRLQRELIAQLFGIRESDVTSEHVRGFGIWITSDPATGVGNGQLTLYSRSHADLLSGREAIWFDTPVEERTQYWRSGIVNVTTAGALVHALRFMAIPKFFDMPEEEITPGHIYAFGIWAFSDPGTETGRKRLADYFEANKAGSAWLRSNQKLWLGTTREERMDYLKECFSSAEEVALLDRVYTASHAASGGMDVANTKLPSALAVSHFTRFGSGQDTQGRPIPAQIDPAFQAFISSISSGTSASGRTRRNSVSLYSILATAKREAEYNTLLSSFGVQVKTASGAVNYDHGLKSDGSKTTHVFVSARVTLSDPDEDVVSLDMIASEAVTGQTESEGAGWNESGVGQLTPVLLARTAFEVYATAGWITTPEDVRRLMCTVDLLIAGQMTDPAGPNLPKPPGATMTVAFQKEKSLWFIHCGHDDGKLVQGSQVAFGTDRHSRRFLKHEEIRTTLRSDVKHAAEVEVGQRWTDCGLPASGPDAPELQGLSPRIGQNYLDEVRAEMGKRFDEAIAEYERREGRLPDTAPCSVLGTNPRFIRINNMGATARPIPVNESSVVLLASNQLGTSVCDHTIPTAILRDSLSDTGAARQNLISIASGQVAPGCTAPECELYLAPTKPGPKVILMRHLETGFGSVDPQEFDRRDPYVWLRRRISAPRSMLEDRQQYQMLIDGCSRAEEGIAIDIIGNVASAAEQSNPLVSNRAFGLAIDFIFNVAAGRPDRDAFLTRLQSAGIVNTENWTRRIIRKLEISSDATPPKRAMFDFAADWSEPETMRFLAGHAQNSEVSGWAQTELSGTERLSAPPQRSYPEPVYLDAQTSVDGTPLDPIATRYLDRMVRDMDNRVVEKVADEMGIRPRDLEIMLFYVCTLECLECDDREDVKPEIRPDISAALNPHMLPDDAGEHLIVNVQNRLHSADAENILRAAYLIWHLLEMRGGMKPDEVKAELRDLYRNVDAMDITTAPLELGGTMDRLSMYRLSDIYHAIRKIVERPSNAPDS